MNSKLKQNLSALALFLCLGGLIGCSSANKSAAKSEPNKAVVSEKTDDKKPDKYPTSPTNRDTPTLETKASNDEDKIGVPECDDYIEKYEACITGKVPEASRQTILSGFKQTRRTWKGLASNPQTKASLAATCKQSLEMTKQAMSQYSCDW